jgi:hypothetical protein
VQARCRFGLANNQGELIMFTKRISLAAVTLALAAASASAAVVTRSFNVNSVDVGDIHSATFDDPLTPCNVSPPDAQECAFFGGYHTGPNRVVFVDVGAFPGEGFLTVDYEDTTGEILVVTRLYLRARDVDVDIDPQGGGHADITVTQGNSAPAPRDYVFVEAGTGTFGRDLDGGGSQTTLGAGTADADQGVAVGQASIFQHNGAPNPDNPDFAVFSDIVDSCSDSPSGTLCPLIPLLNLDGVRYRLEGTITADGGDSLVLKLQTANNSILRVNFTTAAEAAAGDYDGDGDLNGADNCPATPNADQANSDADSRGDVCDNCTLVANVGQAGTGPAQNDVDDDGFGNICDADLNNTNLTTSGDYTILRNALNTNTPNADMNGSGLVTSSDYTLLRNRLNTPPGASGLACAALPMTDPCGAP